MTADMVAKCRAGWVRWARKSIIVFSMTIAGNSAVYLRIVWDAQPHELRAAADRLHVLRIRLSILADISPRPPQGRNFDN